MIFTLSNEAVEIKVDSFGAELKSLVAMDTGVQYMWEGNPVYWKRTSPVLFPLVGSLKDGRYIYNKKEYKMSQHGFARDMEFELVSQAGDEIWFSLLYNEETLLKYPFKFRLEIGYKLLGRSVNVMWRVANVDDKEMYFSVGGHPAFRCPLNEGDARSDCYVRFSGVDSVLSHSIVADGLVGEKYAVYEPCDEFLPINDDLFNDDALIIEESGISEVSLAGMDKKSYLTVKFDAPVFGVWSPVKKDLPPASFVCIEPWYGRCDSTGFEGELCDREYGNRLAAGEVFAAEYTIEI